MAGKLPYKVGSSHIVRCDRLADDGLGRADLNGHELRIRFGVPGETARVTLDHVGHHAVWGSFDSAGAASADRRQAPCPVVEACGGCPWQHLTPLAQRKHRLEALHRLLDPVAPDVRWKSWRPAESVDHGYRTRTLMMLRHVRGRLRAGFYRPRTQDLVGAEDCLVHHPRLQRLVPSIIKRLDASQLPTWRGPKRPGLLRAMALRVDGAARGEGKVLLTLVVTRVDERVRRAATRLLELGPVAGVFANINDRDGGRVLGHKTVHLAGAERQDYRFGDLTLSLGPTAFVQTHQTAAETMLQEVVGILAQGESPPSHVADLYGGVGVFGLAIAKAGVTPRVTIVESAPDAVADARHNIAALGMAGVSVLQADAALGAQQLAEMGDAGPTAAVVDPPRAGMAPGVLEALAAMPSLRRLVYVSCNPKTLARDLGGLVERGWKTAALVPVDMFPNTPHAEVIAVIRRCA